MPTSLQVNGQTVTVDAEDDKPLLWALREDLGLTGTKYGCGIGACGACTVHLDGQAQRSCVLPLAAAAQKHITTIEGLAADGPHALQAAWQALDVPQCGYCQSGMLMAAAALLKQHPNLSDSDINEISNICQCGTYQRARAAIKQAAKA